MRQLVVVAVILKGAQLHHLLEHQEDIVDLGVVNILKFSLDRSDDLVYVP